MNDTYPEKLISPRDDCIHCLLGGKDKCVYVGKCVYLSAIEGSFTIG